ncbi:MAG: hypothetical protein OK474_02540 [Thaumarchaeota archaeon]|nr:hypothetical protein [Nitrososphaerota archaeon]
MTQMNGIKWLPTTRREYLVTALITVLAALILAENYVFGDNSNWGYLSEELAMVGLVLGLGVLTVSAVKHR